MLFFGGSAFRRMTRSTLQIHQFDLPGGRNIAQNSGQQSRERTAEVLPWESDADNKMPFRYIRRQFILISGDFIAAGIMTFDDVKKYIHIADVCKPNPDNKEIYDRGSRFYQRFYETTKDFSKI